MRIQVKAKTKAKEAKVEPLEQQSLFFEKKIQIYRVSVKEAPERGRANIAIAGLLAEYFGVPFSAVRLITGQTSKAKIFEIEN